jgi:hypothetical protein
MEWNILPPFKNGIFVAIKNNITEVYLLGAYSQYILFKEKSTI